MQGIISTYLKDIIGKEVQKRGLVLWLDPVSYYKDFIADLKILQGLGHFSYPIVDYNGSFLECMEELHGIFSSTESPSMLLYLQIGRAHV